MKSEISGKLRFEILDALNTGEAKYGSLDPEITLPEPETIRRGRNRFPFVWPGMVSGMLLLSIMTSVNPHSAADLEKQLDYFINQKTYSVNLAIKNIFERLRMAPRMLRFGNIDQLP